MGTILDRFTVHLKHALGRASVIAADLGAEAVAPLHLLLALALERGSIAAEVLNKVRCTADVLQRTLADQYDLTTLTEAAERAATDAPARAVERLTKDARRCLEKSVLEATTHEHRYVGTEHLLAGIIAAEDVAVRALMAERGVDAKNILHHLAIVAKSTSKFPELTADLFEEPQETSDAHRVADAPAGNVSQKTPALDFFAKELTAPANTAKLDPVIGRDAEIERAVQVLCRRTKNNPILLGEPGVGKTAIVEGLAKKIAERDIPDILIGKRILALDLALIVAGTIYRGEFESRLKQILDEVRQDATIILFIDEIHTIMGAGAASGSLDAANILKPALARGDIRCIGATTYTEYKKHVENDPALERRFQPIHVTEPTPEATRSILAGLKPYYEKFHRVVITDAAVDAAVTFAGKYLTDRRFPDKAIDLIDEAAARVRVHAKNDPLLRRANRAHASLEDLHEAKRRAVLEERFDDAQKLQEETNAITHDVARIRERLATRSSTTVGAIGARDVAEVVGQMIGVKPEEILLEDRERLATLEEQLRNRIVGQDDAMRSIAAALRRAKSGMGPTTRPVASFLLLGPTGVGKTETAKALAELLFQHKDACIRLDMSEFSEGFTVSKLIGAPAGYVGYREGSKLTDAIRRRPASVVLFDEIEKAHPDIWNLLLQILEDGRITDATGKESNFTNAIIVLTSNIGSSAFTTAGIGFASGISTPETLSDRFRDIEADALRELRAKFRPELLNRIDATIVYHPLAEAHLTRIAAAGIAEFASRLRSAHDMRLTIGDAVAPWFGARAFDPAAGARAVRRLIQEHIENPIASGLLSGTFTPGTALVVAVAADGSVLDLRAAPAAVPRRTPARRMRARATAASSG